jgi:UDP-N-acetylmuramyl pentapeptide synthase
MQKLILFLLAFFARNIISFHKPKIIWITGTVGKTTVTAHVYKYLSLVLPGEKIWYSSNHYNWEYGLPLTVIWAKTGWKNPIKWLWVFLVAIARFFRPYPRYLVLEYGIDHPGEMDFLLSIATPDIAIITEVAPNHLEQFGTFELYRKEKIKITKTAKYLIIHDTLRDLLERDAIYYGSGAMSDISISHVDISHAWTSSVVHFHGRDDHVSVRAFWSFHIVNILPLYAIADIWNLPLDKIVQYISHIRSEPGRSAILDGIGGATIVDGSYNGGYLSLHSGINSMRSLLSSHNLIFLIWDMRELWSETENMHKKLADEIVTMFPHNTENISFYLVWPYMREYVLPWLVWRFQVESYLSSRLAWQDIKKVLSKKQEKPTMVFVKWSQNTIFLEEAVELILSSKEDMIHLCRQSPEWKAKKEEFFNTIH